MHLISRSFLFSRVAGNFAGITVRVFSVLTVCAFVIGAFIAPSVALAAHTVTVGVNQPLVRGGSTETYSFNIANNSGSTHSIYIITITAPVDFTVNDSLICPVGWTSASAATTATCTGDPDPTTGLAIAPNSGANVSFSAIAPNHDSTVPWSVLTKDNNFASQTNNPVTTVDATPPTVQSITTKDSDGDGRVDTATIIFSEPVDDSSFVAGNFTIGGATATSIETGTANDNTFDVKISGGVAGTEAKDVIYTPGNGADIVGNPLAAVVTGTISEIDMAMPVFMSARTISPTSVEVTFSENISTTYSKNDFGVGNNFSSNNVNSASNTEGDTTILLTLLSSIGTGDTPQVYYDATWSGGIKDSSSNLAITKDLTSIDGIAPVIAQTRTIAVDKIEVTFTEAMSAVSKDDFTVAGNTIPTVTFTSGQTTAILNLGAPIATDATPLVSTIGSPTGTSDTASPTNNTITGSLTSTPIDGIAPTVVLSSLTANPTNGLIAVTAEFSENVTGFDNTDITVGNGMVTNFVAVDGNTYTFNVDPADGASVVVTIQVLADKAIDAATNSNTASNQLTYTSDTVAPTVTSIIFTDPALKVGETSLVTITFSEAVTGFTNADITIIDNGLLTVVTSADSGVTWTSTFTPTNGITDDINIITVTQDGVADLAGNSGTGATSSGNYAIDTIRPTVTAELDDSNLIAGETATVTLTFSETPSGFDASQVTVDNGSINAVSGGPLIFTATLTPTVDVEDTMNVITVGTGWTDIAGNAPESPASSANYTIETKRPTITLSSLTANPTNGLIAVTAEFSENVTGFDNTDITVGNGMVTNFVAVDGNTYTFNVDPADGASVVVTIQVLADKAIDAATNSNTVSNQLTRISDTVAPTVTLNKDHADLIVRDADTVLITATFNEAMASAPAISIDAVTSDDVVSAPMTGSGATWTYSWNVPTSNDGSAVVTVAGSDLAGNVYAGGDNLTFTIDNIAPSAVQFTPVATPTNDTTPDIVINVGADATWQIKNGAAVLASGAGTGENQTAALSELAGGTYDSVQLIATDVAGNPTLVPLTAFTIDTTLPAVNISSPLADSVTKGTDITLVSSASDASGVTCKYKIDTGSLVAIDCSGGVISGLTDGRHIISLVATDGASNSASADVSLVIDTDNILTVGATNSDFTIIQEAMDEAVANDTVAVSAGVYSENITINKSIKITGSGNPTATSFTFSDNAALLAGSGGITAPTVTVDAGSKIQDGILLASSGGTVNVEEGTYADTFTVNKSVTIDGGEVATITAPVIVTVDNVTLTNLIFSGNLGSSAVINLDSDNTHSGITVSSNTFSEAITTWHVIRAGSNKTDLTITDNTFTGSTAGTDNALILLGAGGSNIFVSNNSFSNFPSTYAPVAIQHNASGGTRTSDLRITNNSIDFTGFTNASEGINVRYASDVQIKDNILTGAASSASYQAGITVASVNSTGGQSLISGNTVQGFSRGIRVQRWAAGDGNSDDIEITNNTVTDGVVTTGSEISTGVGLFLAGVTNLLAQNNTVTGNANVGVYLPATVSDGNASTITNLVISDKNIISGNGAGVNNLTATTIDVAKNWWGSESGPFHSSNSLGTGNAVSDKVNFRPWYLSSALTGLDSTVPTVALTYSVNLAKAGAVTVTATYSEAIAGTPQVSIDQQGTIDITNADMVVTSGTNNKVWTYSYTVNAANGGTYVDGAVTVSLSSVNDPSGNIAESPTGTTFMIDTTAPTTSVTTPSSGGKYKGDIEITADASDDSDIERVEFWHNSTDSLIFTDTSSPYIATWNSTDTEEGNHSIYVKAYDNAGNVKTSDSVTVTLDRTAPTVVITSPTADSKVNGADTVSFTDDESTAPQCSIDNTNWTACSSGTSALGGLTGFNSLTEGSFTLYLRDIDSAGNVGATSVSLIKDSVAPSILNRNPNNGSTGIALNANIIATTSEAVLADASNITLRKGSETPIVVSVAGSGTDALIVNPSVDLSSNTKYTITLSGITDIAGNALPTASWSFITTTTYSIPLSNGWNLISLPVNPASLAVADVLGGLNDSSKIESVLAYDGASKEWLTYHPASPELSSLDTMAAGLGYWINYIAPTNSLLEGAGGLLGVGGPTIPPQHTLYPGWNLIGYYQLENEIASTPLNALFTLTNDNGGKLWSSLSTFDNEVKQYKSSIHDDDAMNPGEGYWIFMKQPIFATTYIYGPGQTEE